MVTEQEPTDILGRLKSRLADGVIEQLVRRFSIGQDAVRNMRSFLDLSGPVTGGFPTELLPLAASMWSGFVLTPFAQQQMEGWVLPYWLRRQSSPSSPSFVPHGHVFLKSNMTMRNWTGVGLCAFPNEGVVDPRGLITPWPFAPSIDAWVMAGGELVCPSELEDGRVRQRLIDDLPLVETSFAAPGLTCTWTTWVAPLDGMPVVLSLLEAVNPGKEEVEVSLAVAARPYNTESICAVNELAYEDCDGVFVADGNVLAYLPEQPDEVLFSDYPHGDVAIRLVDTAREALPAGIRRVTEGAGLATGAAIYRRSVRAGRSERVVFACPLTAGVRPRFKEMLPGEKAVDVASEKLSEQRDSWAEVASGGMRVKVADEAYQTAFDVNKVFLLLMYDGRTITPGVSTYHMMWFRDAAYLVPALERLGRPEMARPILMTYPDRQTPEGFFRSHNGEWDSAGQAMWTLVHHYRVTGDVDFLKTVYPSLMKSARWIDSIRQKGLPSCDPAHGLMPPGISAEHFGINDCYYWDDLWAVGGLRAGALAALDLGLSGDAAYMDGLADEIWHALEASWEGVRVRLGREVMPIAPGRDIDAASIGCLAAVYPLDLIDPRSPLMENTVREIVERCFYRDTHYHGVMHCGINPYLSMHVSQYYLRLRDPYALKIFESLWSMRTSTHTYPEAINPLTGGGAYGDGHDGWAAGDIFNFVRNLFVFEEGGNLVLLPLGKKEWFAEGREIVVEGAPTYFGEVSYRVSCERDHIEFELPGEFERPPVAIELGVPLPVTACEADGMEIALGKKARSALVPPGSRKVRFSVLSKVK